MSRNAIAAMAVIFVSGFAGCAATARADDATAVEVQSPAPARETPASPLLGSAVAATLIAATIYVSAAMRRARTSTPPA
jgi:hypothetical protein